MINNKKIYAVSQHPMRVSGTDFYSDKGKSI
jgi:hypothetical protein